MFEAIIKEIECFDTIIIHRHYRPDGDALGSQIGLKHILKENYPQKNIYTVGDDAGFFSFMYDSKMNDIANTAYENALAVILDCGSSSLISDTRYMLAKRTVRIDHHVFSEVIADTEVVNASFESCCGMIAELAIESGLRMNTAAARALYTGMVTDSGRFRYDSTTAHTFRLASYLLEHNIDTDEIFHNLYADSFESKKRKAQFILKTQFTPNHVAYIYTTLDELEQMQIDTFAASRGMVNVMADIKGTDIWVNFTETKDGVLCELRSSNLNINPIAVKYGGGGHKKASGATVPNRETALAMLHDLDQMIGERQ